jgi:hypothetical protein
VEVELLYWDGCPSHPEALALLQSMPDVEITQREILSDAQAEAERFAGSPTFRVDGEDLFPTDDPPGLTCRVYRRADGRYSPTPDADDLRERLRSRRGA